MHLCADQNTRSTVISPCCEKNAAFAKIQYHPHIFLDIQCGTLEDGMNTEPVNTSIVMRYLDVFIYTCLHGYSTDDEVINLCTPEGTLTLSSPPNCTSKIVLNLFLLFSTVEDFN